jgi:hypothetical protein
MERAISKGLLKKLGPRSGMGSLAAGYIIDKIAAPKLLAKATAKHKLEGSNNVTLATEFQQPSQIKESPSQTQLPATSALPQSRAAARRNLSLLQRKSLDSPEYEKPDDDLVSFERKDKPTDYEYEAAPWKGTKKHYVTADRPNEVITRSSNIKMGSDTRDSSWGGLSADAKLRANKLAKEFKGITVHSGHRTVEEGDKAMLGSKGNLSKYRLRHKAKLTPAQLKAGPGTLDKPSPHRESGIKALRKAGLKSIHEDPKSGRGSRAVDFSYEGMPGSWKENKGTKDKPNWKETQVAIDLRARLKQTNPGAKITLEPGHVHMAFAKPKKKKGKTNAR